MKTVIIGATGTIGNTIAQLLSEKGHEVLKASRNADYVVDLENPESIKNLFSQTGQVDAIICTAGAASFGALSKLTDEDINLGIKSKLMGQVNICRNGMEVLKPNGKIILTGGIFAHQPWPETSNIAMVNAALEGFVKALALEMTDNRSISIVHPPLVRETAQAMGMDGSPHPPASDVAHIYLQGLERDENGKALYLKLNMA